MRKVIDLRAQKRMVTDVSESGLLDTADAAQFLHVHQKTLMRWVREGQLEAMRTPGGRLRFRQSDLDAFIAKGVERNGAT